MTPAERGQIAIKATAIVGAHTGCVNVLDSPLGRALAATKLEVQDVRVSGNLAAIDARLRTPGARRPQYRTYKLQELGGEWKISEVSL